MFKEDSPFVSIIIPTHNRKAKLMKLIDSILEIDYPMDRLEIIVVDDASSDGTYKAILRNYRSLSNLKVIRNDEERFKSYCVNLAVKSAQGEYILIADDDNILDKDLIKELVTIMKTDDTVAAAGAISIDIASGRIWNAGVKYAFPGRHKVLVDIVSGNPYVVDSLANVFMVKRRIFKMLNGFDYRMVPFQDEDEEFLQRVRKLGQKLVVVPTAITYHEKPSFRKVNDLRLYFIFRNRIIILRRYVTKYFFPFLLSLPVFVGWYLFNILMYSPDKKRGRLIMVMFKGIIDGIRLSKVC